MKMVVRFHKLENKEQKGILTFSVEDTHSFKFSDIDINVLYGGQQKGGLNMVTAVVLNDVKINVTRYQEKAVDDPKSGSPLQYITIDFQVRSGEEYHKITTLLYNKFLM